MTVLRQISAVTNMNLRSLPQRVWTSTVIVVGIAGVVGVLVSVLAMGTGFTNAMTSTGRPAYAIVLRSGATNEVGSSLAVDAAQTIMDAPGIARLPDGKPAASPEMFVSVNMLRKADNGRAGIVVRGVAPGGLAIRPEIRITEGRMFQPGLRELIAGRGAQTEFAGLAVGDEVMLRDGPWTVVGTFSAAGTAEESTLLTDSNTLMSAYLRNVYNSVRIKLESAEAYEGFRDALTTNPTLSVNVMTEQEYYRQAAQNVDTLFSVITYVVGVIMAVGAVFAALNMMYSAVSARSVEIATLRAIGFGAGGVVASVLAEAFVLAVIGAGIGAAIAMLLFNGNTVSLGGTVGSLVTEMRVTPALVGAGIGLACFVGLLGGLFPAIRAARLPVATALRAI
jgi:putative ABC transport system permease protein